MVEWQLRPRHIVIPVGALLVALAFLAALAGKTPAHAQAADPVLQSVAVGPNLEKLPGADCSHTGYEGVLTPTGTVAVPFTSCVVPVSLPTPPPGSPPWTHVPSPEFPYCADLATHQIADGWAQVAAARTGLGAAKLTLTTACWQTQDERDQFGLQASATPQS